MNSLVSAYRQRVPNDTRSDDDLTLLFGSAHDQDGRYAGYQDFVDDYKNLKSKSDSIPLGSELRRGLARGVDSLAESAYGAGALASDVVGAEGVRDYFLNKYKQREESSNEENASAVPRVEDVDSFDTGIRFVLGKAGELIPQIAEAFVTGAAGAAVGSAMAPGVGTAAGAAAGLTEGFIARQSAKEIIKAGVEKFLEKTTLNAAAKQTVKSQLEKVAAKEAVGEALHPAAAQLLKEAIKTKASGYGAMGGELLNFYGIGSGAIYGDLGNREGVDKGDAKTAALVGGIGSALANAPLPAVIISRYFPGVGHKAATDYIKRLAKDAAIEIPVGATGETLDELVQIAAEKYADPKRRDTGLDDQDLSRLLNAAVVGGGAGGLAAPISAIPGGSAAKPEPKPSAFSPDISKRYWRDVSLDRQRQIQVLATREQLGKMESSDIADLRSLTPQERNYFTAFKALSEADKNKETARVVSNEEVSDNGNEEEIRQGQGRQVLTEPAAAGTTTSAAAATSPSVDMKVAARSGGIHFARHAVMVDGSQKELGRFQQIAPDGSIVFEDGTTADPAVVVKILDDKKNPIWEKQSNPLTATTVKPTISSDQVKALVALKYDQNDIDSISVDDAQTIIDQQLVSPKADRKARFQKALTSPKVAVAAAEVKLAQEKARAETKPNPTTEEIDKENYPKGRLDYAGIDTEIETAKGEIRQNKKGGVPWHVKLLHDYGHMFGTLGADGDKKDITLGEHPESTRYFVIDQIDPESGEFDEHKSFVGFLETDDALAAYKKSFSDGSGKKRMGGITEMSKEEFDQWRFDDAKATKPLRYKKPKDLAESKPAKTTPASKLTAATTPATPVVAAASTHEEKLSHKRKIDEEHGKLVIQERDDIEFFGKDSDEAKASSSKLRQFEFDNAAWVGAARSALAEKGDTSNLPNVPKAVAVASISENPTAAELLIATPEQVTAWKKQVKYGPKTSAAIAATMTDADYQMVVKQRDLLREKQAQILKDAEALPADQKDKAIEMLQAGAVESLKVQTLNEISQDYEARKKAEVTPESIGLKKQKGANGKKGYYNVSVDGLSGSVQVESDTITLINLKADETGRGAGGAFLEKLKEFSDATGKKLSLVAKADSAELQPRLEKFYEKHGMTLTNDKQRVYEYSKKNPPVPAEVFKNPTELAVSDVAVDTHGTFGSSKRGKKNAPSIVEPAWWRPNGLEARKALITKLLSDRGTPGDSGKQKTKRVTALMDHQTGKVHLVSTYESSPGKPAVTLFDEELRPKGRGQKKDARSLPLNQVLDAKTDDGKPRFEVIGSMRTKELTEFFHQEIADQKTFEEKYGKPLDEETAKVRSKAALMEEHLQELGKEQAAKKGQKKGKEQEADEHAATPDEQLQVKKVEPLKVELSEPGHVDLDDDEVRWLVGRLAVLNFSSLSDFAKKVADGLVDKKTMALLQKTRGMDRDFIPRIIQDGIQKTLLDYDKANDGRTHYSALLGRTKQSATGSETVRVPDPEGRSGQGAGGSSPAVASVENSAGQPQPEGNAGNAKPDQAGGEVKNVGNAIEEALKLGNVKLESRPENVDSKQPIDPEHERVLNHIYEAAAAAGINVKTVMDDASHGLYDPEQRLITHWIGKAIGATDVGVAIHEVAHDVSRNMPEGIRRQVISAIMRLTDTELGLGDSDLRISSKNPEGLAPGILQEERLVKAAENKLIAQGFNPRDANTYAQSFVRAFKDVVYKSVIKLQSWLGMQTNENLARAYFENSVKRLLAGDHSRYSYLDMLGLAKAQPAGRYEKWFKGSKATGERFNADGVTYDHQDNTTPEGAQFNVDNAMLQSLPITDNPRATRTTRVEREVAALNHLIELQDQMAIVLEASEGSDKALEGKTAMEWLRKMLKLSDPQAAKDTLNGRLDFDQKPVEFDPNKRLNDFKDASNKDAILDKMYRDTQAMAHKLDSAIRERQKRLKEIADKKEQRIERITNARKRYADLDEQARVLRIEVDKELRDMSDYVAGIRKRSSIASQLKSLDQNNQSKTYGSHIEKLIADKTITGPRLVEVLDLAAGIPSIDFRAKADEIRKTMRESGKFNALTNDAPANRAMLAAVIAVAKANPRLLAELELRRVKEGRADIEAELDKMIAGTGKPKIKKVLTRADSIRDRILSAYAEEAKKIRAAANDTADLNIDLKALKSITPVLNASVDQLTGELGVAQDFTFKDGAEFLAVKEDTEEKSILKTKEKLGLDTSGKPTNPDALKAKVADMKRFLMKREERYAAGDLTAKNRWYQRVERQYAEMASQLHYNLDGIASARSGLELNLMPEFSAIGDAFGTPAAQLFKRAGNTFARIESFLRNVSDGVYDKDARMRRELTRLLPGLTDDNLQTLIDAAKFDIEDNMADLVELYADRPDKLKRVIYNRVRENILNTKLAQDIGLHSVMERFMPTFEKLLDHEWQAGEEHYKSRVIKGVEAPNPITGKDEATGLKVKDPSIKITDDEGNQIVGQRRHIAKGWRTFGGRRMSNGFNQMVGALRRSDWASFENFVGGERLKEAYKEDPEKAREILNKFFNNSNDGQLVRDWFLRMLASRKQESSFDAPALEDEVTTPPADPEIVNRALEAAPDGDVLQFIENMYDMHDGVSDKATYVQHIADQLNEHWQDVDNIAKKYFPDDGTHNPMNSLAGMSPGALIDAREISGLPSEWFSFYKFDKPSLHKLSRLIAAEVAFGRGSATLAGLMDTVTSEVNHAIGLLEAERARVREANPTWSNEKIDKAIKSMPDYKRLKQFEDRAQLIPNSIRGLSSFFRKDNSIEANLAAGIRLTQLTSRLMVNNPSSAIYQLAALFDPMFRFGPTPAAIKATAAGLKAHLHESVASLAQAIGIQMQNSEHNQRFNDLNLQYPERIKKFGDEFRRWENESAVSHAARVAEETLAFPVGRGENKQHVQFRPTALFDWTTMIADRSLDAGMQNLVGNFMAKGVEFYRKNPELANDPSYQLSDQDLGLKFGDSGTLKQLKVDMQNFGMNYDEMVKNTIKRGDGNIFTDRESLALNAMAMFLVSSQSNIATMKSSAWNNPVIRAAVPLLGWMGRRTLDVAGKRMDENGKLQAKALMRGLAGIAAVSAGGLALSAIVDKYYEELIGKKRNLRPMTSALGLTEHIARVGSTGFFGELANGAISVGQGGDSRIISADRRIVAMSALMTAQQAVSSLINQGEFDYSRVGRPLFSAIGGGGALQYIGMYNKLTGADNVESRINARINAQNYLRVVGRDLNLSVREPSGSFGTPTPMTPYITRMELAAYANNAADFRSAYSEAIAKAKAEGFDDPVDHVKRSFAAKNPLRTVFQTSPSEREYDKILLALPEDGREAVSGAVNSFNRFAESIGARAFEGKADKKSVTVVKTDRMTAFRKSMTSQPSPMSVFAR